MRVPPGAVTAYELNIGPIYAGGCRTPELAPHAQFPPRLKQLTLHERPRDPGTPALGRDTCTRRHRLPGSSGFAPVTEPKSEKGRTEVLSFGARTEAERKSALR
ncbi:hypothetical protein NDU88_005383 [Pleurodeles waltl]|uniref:Uncharacterized protein n=1 Tax=Pleurodeles waltl TaxID=8319 RepID=A0AAV7WCK5_PLEWA|nr:hypothetical protein NDU88_005383 [Pleurodeles waltl]